MTDILLYLILFIVLSNTILMFFLGVYLVRMNERFNQMIQDLVEIISGMDSTIPITDVKSKTWDQKYEDELEEISRRMRQGSGLLDLPTTRSYDSGQ